MYEVALITWGKAASIPNSCLVAGDLAGVDYYSVEISAVSVISDVDSIPDFTH
jgi:hypothetical protein